MYSILQHQKCPRPSPLQQQARAGLAEVPHKRAHAGVSQRTHAERTMKRSKVIMMPGLEGLRYTVRAHLVGKVLSNVIVQDRKNVKLNAVNVLKVN